MATSTPFRLRLLAVAAAWAAPAAAGGAPEDAPGPIRFGDLSAASGGPVAFGAPKATLRLQACAFFDADGDGWDDLVVATGAGEPELFFLNRPDGAGGRGFVPAPAGHGLDAGGPLERDGSAVAAGDVDNDGDEDLVVGTPWNDAIGAGRGRNLLLLNDGAGGFTDHAVAAGLDDGDNTTAAVVLFDMDLDGDLDLFTANSDFGWWDTKGDGAAHLWRNELAETGTLRFVDEAAARGVTPTGQAVWAATAVDYDGDGDGDLLVTHDIVGLCQLYRNDGTGRFVEVTSQSGAGIGDDAVPSTFGDDAHGAMGVAWGDVENDGDLDLYISNFGHNAYYVSHGDGTFAERARTAAVRGGTVAWGVNFEDFDLDGFVDLYVAGGDVYEGEQTRPVRSFLYRNLGDGRFTDVRDTANLRQDVIGLRREMGTACADFDGDGRVDLLVARAEVEGASPYLYRNETEVGARRWLTVRLRGNGRTSNTSAIGARLRIVPKDASGAEIPGRAQLREVEGGDGRSSQSSHAQTVGLGEGAVSADVIVTWPRAGTLAARTQTYRDVPLDRRVVLSEDAREATWRIAPTAELTVPDLAPAEVVCDGGGDPDPLSLVVVESGPPWATVGPWNGGRTIRFDVPRVAAPKDVTVTLLAVAQGADDPESRQTLTLHVVPRTRLASVRRRGASRLELVGDHLGVKGLEFSVDGTVVRRGRVATRTVRRARPPARTVEQRTLLTIPRELRAALKTGAHEVVVRDPARGTEARIGF